MRDFTPEEKELIVNTPIYFDCFDMKDYSEGFFDDGYHSLGIEFLDCSGDFNGDNLDCMWEDLMTKLDQLREKYIETKDERYFIELVRLLPNSYKVVKL